MTLSSWHRPTRGTTGIGKLRNHREFVGTVLRGGERSGCGGMEDEVEFDRERHVRMLVMMAERMSAEYETQEINRLTLAYFAVSGLGILGALDRVDKDQVSSWVLSLQAHPGEKLDLDNGQFYGFRGSRSSQFHGDDAEGPNLNCSHLASTYCALAILNTIGYDLAGMDSESILISMRHLQRPNGSFMPIHFGAEADLRFVYCAAAICYILNNWSGMDKDKAKQYISDCQSYDGGFGLVPGSESHGGATYCAVSALQLMGFIGPECLSNSASLPSLPSLPSLNLPLLLEWCLQRQAIDGGFQGRTNKASDTCYAFWIGGVLKTLGAYDFVDRDALRRFLLSCQSEYGGFTKFPVRMFPDLYHAYYGFSALSLLGEPGLQPLSVELGVITLRDSGT